MFKNYFLIAVRNFWRNKIFSVINMAGLAIGISAALVIYLIVHYEFSFDKFEKNSDRIYRVVTVTKSAGTPFFLSGVPSPLSEAVSKEIPGIEATVPFYQYYGENVTIPNNNAGKSYIFKNQSGLIFADSKYFNLLPYQWLAGSPKTALNEPSKVVLSEERARTYFPSANFTDIIGKQIIYNDSVIITVSGVVKKLDQNTDFIFKEFISLSTISNSGLKSDYSQDNWGAISSSSQLFIRLAGGNTVNKVEAELKTLLKKYNKDSNKDENNTAVFRLQPLNDLHFNQVYGTFGDHSAHKPTLYGLLAVALFLLLLGCINFINLTTAQASQRAKEIGIRKTMGSLKWQLMFQSLSETFFITFLATLLSVVLTPLLLKMFNDFIPKDLHFELFHQTSILFFLVALVIAVSILSGFYPAVILTKYNPVLVLKNQVYAGTSTTRKSFLRKSLTIFQFFIAQVFIIATMITVKQINYITNTDLGFKKDAIISFYTPHNWNNFSKPDNKHLTLLNELKSIPGIGMVSLGQDVPASSGESGRSMTYKDGKKEIETEVETKTGDTNYLKLYQIKLLAGRNVQQSDTTKEYIINETYLHILGFQRPEDIINKNIDGRPVIGVIADFHSHSLHEMIKPMVFFSQMKYSGTFHIALKAKDVERTSWTTTISKIEKAYKKIYPGEEFNYQFFDESIAKFYISEQNISRLLKWATGLTIFISCLGLLGLVIYTTSQRRKEIGVRKVLGASVSQIVSLLSTDFIKLVALAFIIAVPLAWWAMHKWLEDFAYRTSFSWWIFALSGALMIAVALLTLSIQTIRSANANPVKSLRTE
jgi:putative ABC transport system permease protein